MSRSLITEISGSSLKISITGKALLYKVDLVGSIQKNDKKMNIEMQGQVRVGPLKSDTRILSIYDFSEEAPKFISHSIVCPGVRFKENYRCHKDKIIYQKNSGEEKEVVLKAKEIFDPLPLLFKLPDMEHENDGRHKGFLLVGGKHKPFTLVKRSQCFDVEVEGQLLLEGTLLKGGADIQIPKLKVNLKVVLV